MAPSLSPSPRNPSQQNANLISVPDTPTDMLSPAHPEHPAVEEEEARKTREEMPWWKRPSPSWLMAPTLLSAIILSAAVGAQVELYTNLNFTPFFNINNAAQSLAISNPCSSDPGVQAAVAKFTTVVTTVSGILSFLSVGWWGSFSDRHGRSRTLGVVAFGQLMSPLIVIFVAHYVDFLPGGYWFLLVEPIITGATGGIASELAAILAYLSDITPPEKRSGIFSVVLGFFLAGIGLGPILGSFVLRATHNLLSVFYMAAALGFAQAFLIWFVLPESLTTVKMQRAAIRHEENDLPWFKRLFFFLHPLAILLPEKISDPNSSKVGTRDWNLTLLALGYGSMLLTSSSITTQFLYALLTFQWDAEYLGYCLSSIGITRAVFLALILPFVIKFAKKKPVNAPKPLTNSERQPLLSDNHTSAQPTPPTPSMFDLGLARFSILVDIAVYGMLPFAPTGAIFILFIAVGSFGAGLSPAINSVALELYTRQVGKNATVESGRLLGALSVVQAVFANVLGPPMYGSIYATTVATHPRTIFFVALGNAVVAFIILAFVRLPRDVDDSEDGA
ncbi:MFS domain-containing protein [Mycena venus]|uniref:MFS domain-containing protein n=1 Tax=Mycena venus TaxID=2733690 RepID=A0A8H6XWR1_9AGAR|nr:MFS domain-containing protein [Mycena venus]